VALWGVRPARSSPLLFLPPPCLAVSTWEFSDKFKEINSSAAESKVDYAAVCQSFYRVMGMTKGDQEFKFEKMLSVVYPNATKKDIQLMARVSKPQTELTPAQVKEVKDAFRQADVDSSGTITVTEFQEAMGQSYSASEIENMFALADVDESQALDFNEFCKWYAKMLGITNYQHKHIDL